MPFLSPPHILSILYFSLLLLSVFQLVKIVHYRHNLVSFQGGFLAAVAVWSSLRATFFALDSLWQQNRAFTLHQILLTLPLNVQFATFALLLVFLAYLAHRPSWQRVHRRRVLATFLATNIIFLIFVTGSFVYVAVQTNKESGFIFLLPNWYVQARRAFVTIMFLLLGGTLGLYGRKVALSAGDPSIKVALASSHISPRRLISVTLVIFVLFLSRCLYNAFRLVSNAEAGADRDDWDTGAVGVLQYVAWELVPTALIIALFWKIPTEGRPRFHSAYTSGNAEGGVRSPSGPAQSEPLGINTSGVVPILGDPDQMGSYFGSASSGSGGARSAARPSVFDDDLRYDSDVDDSRAGLMSSYASHASYGSINTPIYDGDVTQAGGGNAAWSSSYTPYSTTPFGGNTPPVNRNEVLRQTEKSVGRGNSQNQSAKSPNDGFADRRRPRKGGSRIGRRP
mmetsp:Transcript_12689/g.40098  ORF Transcript_12689/g.40098 Transcript_12689/m.40098 type:complete len:452 (-) Transcript_12689:23-1378(-)